MNRIVVGIDGSAASARALDWALAAAVATDADLDVVHAWSTPVIAPEALPVHIDAQEIEAHAKVLLDECLDAALQRASAVPGRVQSLLLEGDPAFVLVDRARDADHLVVGFHGHGWLGRAFLGSVADRCVHHAHVPVTVVPDHDFGTGIVVGVDGGPDSQAALGFAMRAAAAHHMPLSVLFVYPPWSQIPGVAVPTDMADYGRTLIDDMMQRATAAGAPMPSAVEPLAFAGHATEALLRKAQDAYELVLGADGDRGVSRLLGSVGRRCVHHAPCAVTVVRAQT